MSALVPVWFFISAHISMGLNNETFRAELERSRSGMDAHCHRQGPLKKQRKEFVKIS